MASDVVVCALSLAELVVGEEGSFEEAVELLGEADTLPGIPIAVLVDSFDAGFDE